MEARVPCNIIGNSVALAAPERSEGGASPEAKAVPQHHVQAQAFSPLRRSGTEAGSPRRSSAEAGLYAADGARKYLNRNERQRVLDAAARLPADQALFVLTLAWTGARVSEVLALTPSSFQIEGGVVAIHTLKRRKHHIREVPIPPELIAALNRHFDLGARARDPLLAGFSPLAVAPRDRVADHQAGDDALPSHRPPRLAARPAPRLWRRRAPVRAADLREEMARPLHSTDDGILSRRLRRGGGRLCRAVLAYERVIKYLPTAGAWMP